MPSILLVGRKSASLTNFVTELKAKKEIDVVQVDSGDAALSLINGKKIDVVIVTDSLADESPLSFVKILTKKHPLINCAMVSSLPQEEFHEITEGLGLLMQLPIESGALEAEKMVQLLESISALMGA